MRTTLTIDDDVAFGLRKVQESNPEKPFKQLVNDVLRRGLKTNLTNRPRKRFRIEPLNLGLRKDLSYDNIEELLDIIEGPNRR
jgi:hypothetical protein